MVIESSALITGDRKGHDQIKCLDLKARRIQFVEVAPESVIEEVQAKIEPLLL